MLRLLSPVPGHPVWTLYAEKEDRGRAQKSRLQSPKRRLRSKRRLKPVPYATFCGMEILRIAGGDVVGSPVPSFSRWRRNCWTVAIRAAIPTGEWTTLEGPQRDQEVLMLKKSES